VRVGGQGLRVVFTVSCYEGAMPSETLYVRPRDVT
jgi:hypothetical protein